jgi:hypothetical protein
MERHLTDCDCEECVDRRYNLWHETHEMPKLKRIPKTFMEQLLYNLGVLIALLVSAVAVIALLRVLSWLL